MEEPRIPHILARITDSTSDAALERFLRARRASMRQRRLVDHALPSDTRWRGLTISEGTPIIPRVGHASSPFVLSLRHPAHTVPTLDVRINFLEAVAPTVFSESTADDLALAADDIQAQLLEDALHALNIPRRVRSLASIADTAVTRFRREPTYLPDAPVPSFLVTDTLTPEEPVASPVLTQMHDAFDLPEFEEEDLSAEDDVLMEFVDPTVGVVQTIEFIPAEETAPSSWTEPQTTPITHEWRFWHRPRVRAMAAFVLLSFAVVLPLHAMQVAGVLTDARDTIVTQTETGASLLSSAAASATSQDANGASRAFAGASTNFTQAGQTVSDLGVAANAIIAALPSTSTVASGRAMVSAGHDLSIAGERIAEGIASLGSDPLAAPTDRVSVLKTYLEGALPYLQSAQVSLERVDPSALPDEAQDTTVVLKETLPRVVSGVQELIEVADAANVILGADGTKRYLAVFQNNTEIRPTGGFMGSFAELDISHGDITRLSVPGGGTYDLRSGVTTPYIAPKPLRLLSAAWEFQDANWFPDFPTSARQVMQFYEHAGGPTVDGVVAVNATYVADLLTLLGPIEMPEYDRTITAENFLLETQKIVELEYDKEENTPKAFIGDLAPKLIERAKRSDPEQFLAFLDRLQRGLAERDIQIYFTNSSLQKLVVERGWSGQMQWTDGDYLMVVDTNLGGGKTDGVIDQHVDLNVQIDKDGQVENTVTITRTHYGESGSLFSGVNNVDYLRLYVPKGSTLLDAKGFSIPDASLFEAPLSDWLVDDDLLYGTDGSHVHTKSGTDVYEEAGKTVFGNWVQVKPGTSSTITFHYRLPFTVDVGDVNESFVARMKRSLGVPSVGRYTLTLQKQSGILDRQTDVHVRVPETWETVWSSHELDDATFTNRSDAFFAALFEQARP